MYGPNKTKQQAYPDILFKSPGFSVHSEPQILYKLPKRSKLEKFEDALLCQCPLVSEIQHLSGPKLLTTNFTEAKVHIHVFVLLTGQNTGFPL